ncbi:aftiphilin [Elysia marginata]|uniref:Aftiphilin n=1 Tax=Elysia marginata TaxID=1093978 RepID=A0AAV4FUT6_9GAST|nr:aftiphilin [Elysia marginata]
MSNIIPIVSSSPPPFDDDGGWDDEDDDFGNFASAPNSDSPEKGGNSFAENDLFEVNWSSTDTFQNAEESSDNKSGHEITSSPVNFPTGEPPGFHEVANSESSKPIEKHKQCHKASNLELNVSPRILGKREESLHTNIYQISSSDIHNSATDAVPTSDSFDGPEPESCNTGQENNSELPNTGENETSPTSKITESVVSNASITDSGVFSSDLSPSSYPESSSTVQNGCDIHTSPDSYVSVTAEMSNNVCNGDFSDEGHQTCLEETQAKNESIQNEETVPSSPSHNCDSGENDDCGWGDFNEADSNTSIDKENMPSSAFDSHEHSTSTCDQNDKYVNLNEFTQDSVSAVNSSLNGYGTPDEETKQPSHLASIRSSNSVYNNDTNSPRDNECDPITKNEQEVQSDGVLQNKEDNRMFEAASVELQKAAENCQSDLQADFFSSSSTHGSSLPNDERYNAFDELKEDTNYTSGVKDKEMDSNHDYLAEERHISTNNDDVEKAEHKSTLNDCDNVSEKTDDNCLSKHKVGDPTTSPHIEKNDDWVDCEFVQENVGIDVVKDTKADDDLDYTEFGSFGKKSNNLSEEVTPITFRTSVCESDEDEKKEDIDQESPPPFDEVDDEFGDFGDFSSMPAAGLSGGADDYGDFDPGRKKEPEKPSGSVGDDDDDFGDFGDASGDQDGGWANFGNHSVPASESQPESSNKDHMPSIPHAVTAASQGKSKIAFALEKCFPVGMDTPPPAFTTGSSQLRMEETVSNTNSSTLDPEKSDVLPEEEVTALDVVVELGMANPQEAKQQTWTVVQHPAKKDPRVRVWGQMKDVDACHALGYAWPTSHCSQEVFSTLHIDTQNILFTQKKQAVPFFASGLGILEPTRGGSSPAEAKKEKISGLGSPLQPTLLDTTASSKQPQALPAQDIPPVDFDWSVSGLTNPLTANTLDLDFLVVQGSDSCEKTSVFKSDSEAGGSTQPGLQPLEEMLKKSTPTAKLTTLEVLSPEAQSILTKMPDLSFMQSKVLMFPIKQ